MKNILIVGSTSTLGTSVGSLLAENNNVFYAGRRNADYYLDLGSVDLKLPENLQFDVVIHTAADFGGNEEKDFCRSELVNAIGTLNVCRLARKAKVKHLIIVSSMFANYVPTDAYYSIYSLSKKHGDELAQLFCNQFNLPLTILRPSQLYDAESKCKAHQGLFYSIIEKAQKGEDIDFYGNNDALRNYLFLNDFSEIIARAIEEKVIGTFNCPSPNSVRLGEIARTAYRIFNQGGDIHFLADKPNIVDLPEVCGNDLYQKIGFKPQISLAEGIQMIKDVREMI